MAYFLSLQLANAIPDENCLLKGLLVFQIRSFQSLNVPEYLNTSNCVPSNYCFLQKVCISISSPGGYCLWVHTVMNTGAVKYGLRSIVGFINEIIACFVKGWVWFFVEYVQGTGN